MCFADLFILIALNMCAYIPPMMKTFVTSISPFYSLHIANIYGVTKMSPVGISERR